jgi:hypothetical protein
MIYTRKGRVCFGAILGLLIVSGGVLMRSQGADLLKYSLVAKPGNIVIDRTPPVSSKTYSEELEFNVTNPRKSDFHGQAPNCQTFDVEVFYVGIDHPTSVWKWSKGKEFCQMVTPITISAGKSWTPGEKVEWSFTASDLKDGKYYAVATFIPTGNKTAKAYFTITSTQ